MTRPTGYNRREFLQTTGAGAVSLALGPLAAGQPASRRRPNILFIMTDDHAAHALSCYGSRINQTPHLDRLAREGVRFSNCFCTNSICAPSRAAILTGKYGHANGVVGNRNLFDGAQPTFPKLLREAGYQTAMIGKWHLKTDPTGFDHWNIFPGQGAYHDPVMIHQGQRTKHTGYATDLVTDFCLDWLRQRDTNRPFMLMCQHKAPHRNWQPDEKHAEMFADRDIPEPATFDDDYATRCEAARHQAMTIAEHMTKTDTKGLPPEGLSAAEAKRWRYQRYIKDYLRCVASVDDNVGRMLDFLETSGLARDTVVVYTSDQGFFLGDHGWYDKRFMYEESLRMPLLVRYPAEVAATGVSDAIALNIDFGPTFLDLAGVPVPAEMQGESLQPILRGGKPADWRKSMYYHYYEYGHEGDGGWHRVRPHYGVRTARYKLIHFYDGIDCWELFDLEKDPHELNNIYENPAYADTVKFLQKELRRLQAQYNDRTVPAAQGDA